MTLIRGLISSDILMMHYKYTPKTFQRNFIRMNFFALILLRLLTPHHHPPCPLAFPVRLGLLQHVLVSFSPRSNLPHHLLNIDKFEDISFLLSPRASRQYTSLSKLVIWITATADFFVCTLPYFVGSLSCPSSLHLICAWKEWHETCQQQWIPILTINYPISELQFRRELIWYDLA